MGNNVSLYLGILERTTVKVAFECKEICVHVTHVNNISKSGIKTYFNHNHIHPSTETGLNERILYFSIGHMIEPDKRSIRIDLLKRKNRRQLPLLKTILERSLSIHIFQGEKQ